MHDTWVRKYHFMVLSPLQENDYNQILSINGTYNKASEHFDGTKKKV